MFQRAMGVILEMILTVSARSGAAEQKGLSAQVHKAIAALSSTEFPNLTELREVLIAETVEAGASKPSQEVAALYAGRLIATLSMACQGDALKPIYEVARAEVGVATGRLFGSATR
jgi:hypothetical protein